MGPVPLLDSVTNFHVPEYTFAKVAFTFVGASVFWARLGRKKLQPYVLPTILDILPLKPNSKWRAFWEFAVFAFIGCVAGIGVADPRTVIQAITAGFAWTGVFAHPKG